MSRVKNRGACRSIGLRFDNEFFFFFGKRYNTRVNFV